jgi:hypothetical protein
VGAALSTRSRDDRCSGEPGRGGQWRLDPTPDVPARVRHQLQEMFGGWGLSEEHRAAALLVVTELVTNAVEHAGTHLTLHVGLDGALVHVEVADDSAEPPVLRAHDPFATRGRGIQMVNALSLRWGWAPLGRGKTVWADVLPGGWPSDPES